MLFRSSFAALVLVAAVVPASAQQKSAAPPSPFPTYQGTPEDQKACNAPVQRYCREAIPDQFRVLQCLQANREKIGKACQAVLTNYGQ
jgi:hypothetical protein